MDKIRKIKEWISTEQDGLMDTNGNFLSAAYEASYNTLCSLDAYIDSMQEEPVSSIWHDASEEPKDMSHCLIYYKAGDKVTYMDIIPVLYNKNTKEFVSHSYPHATDNKIEYGSIEGHGVVNVFKNVRDRYPITDIDRWAYIVDVLNVAVRSKEPASEDLEEAIGEYCSNPDNFATWIGGKETDDIPLIVKAIKFGAIWQKDQMMKDAVKGGCFSYRNGYKHISCDIDEKLTDIKLGDKKHRSRGADAENESFAPKVK